MMRFKYNILTIGSLIHATNCTLKDNTILCGSDFNKILHGRYRFVVDTIRKFTLQLSLRFRGEK